MARIIADVRRFRKRPVANTGASVLYVKCAATASAISITLEKVLDKYLEPEEAQLVWRRIELLQEDMDREPKSFGWMINQFIKRPTEVPR